MIWATLLIQMLPVIIKLIDLAEKIWVNEHEAGVSKKEFVMMSTKNIIEEKLKKNKDRGLDNIGEDIWSKLEGPVSDYIEATYSTVCEKEK